MDSLRGKLLVATPSLYDPNFRRTVVLIAEHGPEGAMGIVLNRPSDALIGEAVPDLAELAAADDRVYVGGPVQPQAVVVLAEFDEPSVAAAIVCGDLGFAPAGADYGQLARSTRRARVFAGYAGWSSGQLEDEIAGSSWLVEPADGLDLLPGTDADLFGETLRRKGGPYRMLALLPDDPSKN